VHHIFFDFLRNEARALTGRRKKKAEKKKEKKKKKEGWWKLYKLL
jgi:hypothetical protein